MTSSSGMKVLKRVEKKLNPFKAITINEDGEGGENPAPEKDRKAKVVVESAWLFPEL